MENKYKERSTIVCPNCNEKMDLVIEDGKKTGKCKNCNYEETDYNNQRAI